MHETTFHLTSPDHTVFILSFSSTTPYIIDEKNGLQAAVCRDGGPQKNAICHDADFTLASAMTML